MREANVSIDAASFAAMGIEELIALGEAAGIRDLEELACHGTGAVVQVATDNRYDESRLESLEYVDNWEHVAETGDGHVYVIAFTAPELPESLAAESDELLGTCDPDLGDEDATMSLVGSQETIASAIEEYETAGVSPDLRRLGPYEGGDGTLEGLTDRQREVIETAHELGYYEVPREATTEDIAAELALDPSTVTEHLQRAERNVLGPLLS